MWNILGKITVKDEFSAAFDNLSNRMGQASKKADEFSARMAGASLVASAGFAATATAAWKGMGAYEDYTNEIKKLDIILKATNNNIGLSRDEIVALAEAYDQSTDFTKEQVLASVSFLATQKNISGELVKNAIPAITGLAKFMGTDLTAATRAFAKALENPEEGLNAFVKAGVRFTDQEKQKVKSLITTGQQAQAQQFILERLEESGVTGLGSITTNAVKMEKAFGGISEAIGKSLTPVLQPVFDWFYKLAKQMEEYPNVIGSVIAVIGVMSGAILTINGAVGLFSLVMNKATLAVAKFMLTNPFGWLIIGAAAITAFVVEMGGINQAITKVKMLFQETIIWFYQQKDKMDAYFGRTEAMDKNLQAILDAENELFKLDKRMDDLNNKRETKEEAHADKKVEIAESWAQRVKRLQQELIAEESNNLDSSLKENLKTYGKISKEDMSYFRDKKKQEQTYARQTLTEEQKVFRRKQQLQKNNSKFSEGQVEKLMAYEDQMTQEQEDNAVRKAAIEQDLGTARMDVTKEIFGSMTALMQSESKELFRIGQAAAIANATINTYEAVTKTMASVPYPFNIPLAIAQGLAGFVQVKNIASQKPAFATGGVVGGLRGASMGSDNQQATVRTGEMILNANQQKQLWDVANNNKSVNNNSNKVINDYSRTIINVKAGSKEFESIVKKVINDDKKEKARKDQFVRGRR